MKTSSENLTDADQSYKNVVKRGTFNIKCRVVKNCSKIVLVLSNLLTHGHQLS